MWLWGREMETYVEGTAGKVLDRGGEALRWADDFLQDTKAHVSEVLRVGQEAMRPAPAAETHDHARADSAVKPVLSNRSDAGGGAVVRS